MDWKKVSNFRPFTIIFPNCWSCTRQLDFENSTWQSLSTNWPTKIRLLFRSEETKTLVKDEEISPTTVIAKWLPSVVWILRSPKYLVALVRKWALFVIWLEAIDSKYQGTKDEKVLPESPNAECRNLSFDGRVRRKAKGASSHEENVWNRRQRLFEENVRKTKKRFGNFENKSSGVSPHFVQVQNKHSFPSYGLPSNYTPPNLAHTPDENVDNSAPMPRHWTLKWSQVIFDKKKLVMSWCYLGFVY